MIHYTLQYIKVYIIIMEFLPDYQAPLAWTLRWMVLWHVSVF